MEYRVLKGLAACLFVGLLAPSLLQAQSEDALAQYFLGHTVTVKMDMPASKDGVDVFPGRQPDINYHDYTQRVKRFGVSLHSGDSAPITKIKVKDKLVEFHLGGGGYGTAGDETDVGSSFTPIPKSGREKDLERDIKKTDDPKERHHMQEELEGLRQRREREDARLQAAASVADEERRRRIFAKAQQSGSRFNLRFPEGVIVEKLTPDVMMDMLSRYVDFGGSGPTPTLAAAPSAPAGIHKGMLQGDVDGALGRPVEVQRGKEGELDVSRSTYQLGESVVEALFVEGVLVRYTITSK